MNFAVHTTHCDIFTTLKWIKSLGRCYKGRSRALQGSYLLFWWIATAVYLSLRILPFRWKWAQRIGFRKMKDSAEEKEAMRRKSRKISVDEGKSVSVKVDFWTRINSRPPCVLGLVDETTRLVEKLKYYVWFTGPEPEKWTSEHVFCLLLLWFSAKIEGNRRKRWWNLFLLQSADVLQFLLIQRVISMWI